MNVGPAGLLPGFRDQVSGSQLARPTCFGDSLRNAKKTLYSIDDYVLRFWYQVYSPHRSRWHLYDRISKLNLIREHAGNVLEGEYRKLFQDSSSYWEGDDVEFDCVRFSRVNLKKVIVSEIELRTLSPKEKVSIERELEQSFIKSKLARKFELERAEILDGKDVIKLLK